MAGQGTMGEGAGPVSAGETVHRPSDEAELAEVVRAAAARRTPLEVVGGGTKRTVGRPVQAAATLDLSHIAGVTLYEPAELVISARAGTPLAEIQAVLAEQGQMLAFEPPELLPLLGARGRPSIGAVAAMNLSGPRRIQVGAARDALIGLRFVDGQGQAVKNGGRVMKNVTGYDLVKLMAGAYGTLGVLSEVTFKVLPRPETSVSLLFRGLDDAQARSLLSQALGSPYEVSGAAHLPSRGGENGRTVLRLEGFEPSVRERARRLRGELKGFGRPDLLAEDASTQLWRDIAELAPLNATEDRALWRISTAPKRGPEVAATISAALDARIVYDWGGGLVWAAVPEEGDAGAGVIRAALGGHGHATLMRASAQTRLNVEVFEPLAPAVMALTRGLKARFDPAGVLNPGRMHAGV
jgi:glycolate oxidase FAD binding subunit